MTAQSKGILVIQSKEKYFGVYKILSCGHQVLSDAVAEQSCVRSILRNITVFVSKAT